nr:LOW QUALITY PROTEIN: uncharacterized protein LOC116768667 [Danaus plexippus plexippus]
MEPIKIDYCDITSQLDAREILRYLNNLGIKNISGEALKCFITDLKKLIKYDLQHKNGDNDNKYKQPELNGPERLHSASTFSSRIRSKGNDNKLIVSVIKVPIQPIKKKNDPVSLYHYYTSLWAKYKSNVPGENNWSDLRWSIRQKMVGNTVSQTSNKVTDQHPNVHKKQNTA